MRQLLLTVAAVTTLGFSSPATAQGVPTFDGSALGQLVAQLEHMAEDLNVQMQQLATMRLELETQLSQLTNLEAQLTSLIEGSGLGELFATVEEFRALRGKLVAPLNTAQSLASGDFLSGFNPGAELSASVELVLTGSGFTSRCAAPTAWPPIVLIAPVKNWFRLASQTSVPMPLMWQRIRQAKRCFGLVTAAA